MILVDSLYQIVHPVRVVIPVIDLIWISLAGMAMSVFALIGAVTVLVLLKSKQ
jgi:hypothetical protein